jgi:zinc protease
MTVTKFLRIAACAVLFTAGALAAKVTFDPPTAWPKTDVPADPSITFGTLPNGMRYLVQRNTHPEHAVSFHFRIATGSFHETPEQAGISHFIEHMIFRGTAHIPDGELFKRLEALGLAAGADANAHTGAEATVYTFDFPANNAKSLEAALTLTRDIASDVLFDPKAVDSERQVVLSEFRLRDTPQLRMARAGQKALYGDELGEAVFAIGTEAALNAADAEKLKAYYRAHYRPERATLIVVGDIDPKAIEAEIKARFSNWKAAAKKLAPPSFDVRDPPKAISAALYVENGANSSVQLSWRTPFDPTPETRARDERDTVREIAFRVLNLRLHKLAVSADPPYLQAGARAGNAYRATFVASLGAAVGSGDPKRAIKALHETLALVLRDGVNQDEVDRAIAQQRTAVQTSVTAAPTRKTTQLTSHYLGAISDDGVIDAPDNWLSTFEGAVKGLTAERVSAELRSLFGNGEPMLIASSPTPIEGGQEALIAAWREPVTLPAPNAAAAKVVWPYTDFGPAGTVKSQKILTEVEATQVEFVNGVKAIIKPTAFQKGQVQILVRIGNGRFALSKEKAVPQWAIAGAWGIGGINRISVADMPQALSGKQWGATPDFADSALHLSAQTQPSDLATELQVLTAYVTDPAWRAEALAKMKSGATTSIEQAMTTPGGTFGHNYGDFIHAGDKRWAALSVDAVKATELAAVKALIADDLRNGAITIIIVGDVELDAAITGLKQTFAAIGPRKIKTAPYPGREEMPETSKAAVFFHKGKTQEAVAMLGWKTTGLFPDTQNARVLRVVEAVIRTRLFDELRTKEGISYSPQASSRQSRATSDVGLLAVMATIPAPKLADFSMAAKKVAADLSAHEISSEELERAREPLVKEAEQSRESNAYWLNELAGLADDPRTLDLITGRVEGYKKITATDVHAAAQKYLKDERTVRMIVVPEGFSVPSDLP